MSDATEPKLPKRASRYLGGALTTLLVLLLALGGVLAYHTLSPAYDPPVLPTGELRLDENHAASTLLALLLEDTTSPPVRLETFALARERVINILEREYVQPLGLEARRKDPLYVATLRASRSTRDAVVLLSYVDLPPVDPEGWRCDPRGERRADEICGAGARVGKVKVVTDFEAVAALKRSGAPLPFHVVLVVLFDAQEGGEKSIKELLSTTGVLSDMKIRAVLDASGYSYQGFPPQIFPVAVAEKRGLWLRLFGEGPAGEAALPEPDYASSRLVSGLYRLHLWNKGGQRLLPVVEELCRRMGDSFAFPSSLLYKNPSLLSPILLYQLSKGPETRSLIEASLGTQAFSAASEAPGKVPRLAEARLEVRLLPDQDPNAFLGEVRRTLAEDRISLEVLRMDPPAVETSFEAPFFRAVEGAVLRVLPQKIVAPTILPGSTLASPLAYAGTPVLRIPLPARPNDSPEESIRLTELRDAIELTYQILFGASLTEGDPFADLVARRY